jgi:hypothetical protein
LDAVPFIPESVEMKEDSAGNLQMRVEQKLSRLRTRVANWLGQDHSIIVALDEHGSFFIRQIDGQKDLRQIVDAMVENSGRSREDVEAGVMLYTKKLMMKNMIALKLRENSTP